jgi:hypothetical protein
MATGPALHVVTKAKLVTASFARPCHVVGLCLALGLARARPLRVLPLAALALSLSQLVMAAFAMAVVIPAYRTPLRLAGTTAAFASLPLVPRVRSPEPASPRATVALARATAALHARGQAAASYPSTGGASRGCAVAAQCRVTAITARPHRRPPLP